MIEMAYEFEKLFLVETEKFVKAFGDIATPQETAIQDHLPGTGCI